MDSGWWTTIDHCPEIESILSTILNHHSQSSITTVSCEASALYPATLWTWPAGSAWSQCYSNSHAVTLRPLNVTCVTTAILLSLRHDFPWDWCHPVVSVPDISALVAFRIFRAAWPSRWMLRRADTRCHQHGRSWEIFSNGIQLLHIFRWNQVWFAVVIVSVCVFLKMIKHFVGGIVGHFCHAHVSGCCYNQPKTCVGPTIRQGFSFNKCKLHWTSTFRSHTDLHRERSSNLT